MLVDILVDILIYGVLAIVAFMILASTVKIVPQKKVFIVERLGKFSQQLEAGLHILIPFVDRVAYQRTLKEQAIDVPSQSCITKDNIGIEVDGILYLRVVDPKKASYGIENYQFAATELAQTTMRSVIGKLELDRTLEERETINAQVVTSVDKAAESWGVKVTRYEIKNVTPPKSIIDDMEKQMRAERERRATIAESEGYKKSEINKAEGDKQSRIARSEAEKQAKINESAGRAAEIEVVATATAKSITQIAEAIEKPGGGKAVELQVAKDAIAAYNSLAKKNNSMIVPADLSGITQLIATATKVLGNGQFSKKTEEK